MRIAAERKLGSIAFPAVGAGIAGFPLPECAEIMLHEVAEYLQNPTSLEKVYFVLFDERALAVFEKVLAEIAGRSELDDLPPAGRGGHDRAC